MKKLARCLASFLGVVMVFSCVAGCQFLPAIQPTQPTGPQGNISENYETRVDFGAKFEPKGNYILHIGGQDTTAFSAYCAASP